MKPSLAKLLKRPATAPVLASTGQHTHGESRQFSCSRPNLRLVLPLTLALLSLATGALVTWKLASIASTYTEETIGEHLNEQAMQLSSRLDLGMYERYREIQILTRLIPLAGLRLESGDAAHLRGLLDSLQDTYEHYAWIGFTDTRGRVLASTGGLLEGANVSTRPWWLGGLRGPFAGDLHEAKLLADLLPRASDQAVPRFVDVAAPVYDQNGALIGVLGAHLYWRWADEVVKSVLQPFAAHDDVEAIVLNREGDLLLSSGPAPRLDRKALADAIAASDDAASDWVADSPGEHAYIKAYHQGRGYRDYPGLGWIAVVRQPQEVAYRTVTELREDIVLWGLVIGASFALVGLILAGWITRPLTALTLAARRLSGGDLHSRIPLVSHYGEVAQLSGALRQLLEALTNRDRALTSVNNALRDRANSLARANESLATAQHSRAQVERERDSFFDLSADLMAICDDNLRLRRVNRGWGRILGFPSTNLAGSCVLELIHPEDRARTEEAVEDLRTSGGLVDFESRLRGADGGGDRWIQWRVTASVGLDGERLYFATGRDITEQRRDREQLLIWGKVINAIRTGYVVTDPHQPDNPIIALNPAFTAISGYSAEETIGRNCRFLQREDCDQPGLQEIRLCLQEERACEVEIRNYRKDGSLFWNEVLIAPIHDQQGRLLYNVGVLDDVTERKRFQEQLERQATHDTLTGLPNRALLHDRLQRALVLTCNKPQPSTLSVLFINLDRFKQLNDYLGHVHADRLLQAVSERLVGIIGESDTVARQGSDEFVVIAEAPTAEGEDTAALAERVHRGIAEPFLIEKQEVHLTASIGVSRCPTDGDEPDLLLRRAEDAMRQAKLLGRNSVCHYYAAMTASGAERAALERALRRAIERGELELHYQPQLDLGSRRTIGCEALLRWRHEALGWISPAVFIPMAEESGLIHSIGTWVLETACRQLRDWDDQGLALPSVSVNVSARQFQRGEIIQVLQRLLAETGLEPSRIELEITETVMMEDARAMLETLQRLKALGVLLAVDDFGTGYASLSYLKRFPVDRLKIDRAFIRDLPDDPDDAAIAVSVIGLARSLRLLAIAEGVETEEQLAFLSAHGCHQIQGYHYSRPLPGAGMAAFLGAQ